MIENFILFFNLFVPTMNDDLQSNFESDFDIALPNVPVFVVYGQCSEYLVDFPDDNIKMLNLSPQMAKVINNIRKFECSPENLHRQVKTYFSKFKSIFLYEILTNIIEIPFRIQISIELIEDLLCSISVLPYLFYSLILIISKTQSLDVNQIAFIELLKMKSIISFEDYSKIIKFINSNSATCNYQNFLSKQINQKENAILEPEDIISDEIYNNKDKDTNEDQKNSEEDAEEFDNEIEENELLENIKDEMILFPKGFPGNRYSIETKKFASLLYYSSRYSLYLMRQLFALPCERTIEKFTESFIQDINKSLFDIKKMDQLLTYQNIKFNKVEDCTIGVDAAVFNPISGRELKKKHTFLNGIVDDDTMYSSIFVFEILPLNPNLHSFPVNVMIKETGFADDTISLRRNEIIQKLQTKNMNFIFSSSDGDKHFDAEHEDAFHEYEPLLENGVPFDILVQKVGKRLSLKPWPVSDPFHLIKRIRIKSLFTDVALSLLQKYDQNELDIFIQSSMCIKDKSSQGAMKDSYPLTLFGYESFIASKQFTQSHFLIFPLYLFIEALRNSRLKKDIRKKYLNTSFIFFNYFIHSLNFVKTVATRMQLIRMMNTILAICYALDRNDLNISHLGTHPIECFFGVVRVNCHYNHSFCNVIHAISKSVICHKFMDDLNIKKKIYGRKTTAGAKIDSNTQGQIGHFPFTPDEIFLFFLKRLYNLPFQQIEIYNYEEWIKYVIQNHCDSDDSDLYTQGNLAGCNIFCRNIAVTKNRKKPIENKKPKETKELMKSKNCFKNNYLKKYPEEMNELIKSSLMNAITLFKGNSFAIVHNYFGFIIHKNGKILDDTQRNLSIVSKVFIELGSHKKAKKKRNRKNKKK